ncbi:NUDIX hydrolase [Spirulina subsalsa]|uniref:NUDIX hydrolase n=1 Tax=Spirulina subsalsa TaxID=54311 RepID=UPI00035E80FA|nr:NUDIX hydrolase [Spirulina subsalsa]
MNSSLIPVAVALLYQPGRFLMQLRDDLPTILYPGYWAFFGGHLEPGETPAEGLKRELWEEIRYTLTHDPYKFGCYSDQRVIRHVFALPLTVSLTDLQLCEGQDWGLLSLADIERGACFSSKANSVRPISPLHRQILLDFIGESSEDWSKYSPNP